MANNTHFDYQLNCVGRESTGRAVPVEGTGQEQFLHNLNKVTTKPTTLNDNQGTNSLEATTDCKHTQMSTNSYYTWVNSLDCFYITNIFLITQSSSGVLLVYCILLNIRLPLCNKSVTYISIVGKHQSIYQMRNGPQKRSGKTKLIRDKF